MFSKNNSYWCFGQRVIFRLALSYTYVYIDNFSGKQKWSTVFYHAIYNSEALYFISTVHQT